MYLLRGTILNRTLGYAQKPVYCAIFTNNIWSCLLWSPVIITVSKYLIPVYSDRADPADLINVGNNKQYNIYTSTRQRL